MSLPSAGGARNLLRRLRGAMAERTSAQDRLDRIVRMIAADMVAEVCSIYLMRAGGELELFATEGLNPSAVHATRLKRGEGIVGDIALNARPLNLTDAQTHPNFSYRPETGEDPFHSMMGVPILRDGKTLGVVAVQNKTRRLYDEEEIEALQTIAMVLAEMAVSGELIPANELEESGVRRDRPYRARGSAIADGLAIGHAVLHEPRVKIERLIAEDPEAEREKLEHGVEGLRASIDEMVMAEDISSLGETREILEAYRMFANDSSWVTRMREAIASGLTAEAAVERVASETRARMARASDPYLRERMHDLDDLANRLLRHVAGLEDTAAHLRLPDDTVLIARSMGPAELLDYDRTKLKALVLEEGSPTSHVAIVARALGIPFVGRIENLLENIDPDNRIIVDGESGEVHIRPAPEVVNAYRARLQLRAQRQAEFATLRDKPAVTTDGVTVTLMLNAGLADDLKHLDETGASGIGLFRTELPFMVATRLPTLAEQTALYASVLDAAGPRGVTFRTLDLGGDKVLPYMPFDAEENPAMGWRAIRISLDRPALLRIQLRALLTAAAGRALSVMFPMIANAAEFHTARGLMQRELRRAQKLGQKPPARLELGAMLEVPSLGWDLPGLFAQADFASIGTNDLVQFFFAADRGNPKLGDRYDTLSPAFLRFMQSCIVAASAAGRPIAICGEMGGKPIEALALVGLGAQRLSMQPHSIGPVKQAIRAVAQAELAEIITGLMTSPAASIRPAFKDFLESRGVTFN